MTDAIGRFSVALPQGSYELSVEAPGFNTFTTAVVLGSTQRHLEIALTIAVPPEQVAVPIDQQNGLAAADNGNALVFQGAQLDTFSDDTATFQQELAALAGTAGQTPTFYIDGFTGGKVPPKSTVREVRINSNPYSAVYDKIGYGRVEIFTKPGGDSYHGYFQVSGNDDVFNARNPYTGAQPPYYTLDLAGNLNGPIGKRTSFATLGEFNTQKYNSIVNAYTLPFGGTPVAVSEAVASPQSTLDFDTRIDRQVTANNTLTAHFIFTQSALTNAGLTGQVLPEAAYNNGTTTQTLQFIDNQVIGVSTIAETRFQYIRTRLQQNALGNTASLVVEGVSTGGSANTQSLNDNQDQYEYQEYVSHAIGAHYLRLGGRYRLYREANLSTAGYNGLFVFPSLTAYQRNAPTEFTLTTGRPSAAILTGDLSLYAEDEWKALKHLTLDYGLRLESQTAVPDHFDPAPRAGFAWAIVPHGKSTPLLTVRGGAGIFYDRFTAANLLTTVRQNGITQQAYIQSNPGNGCYLAYRSNPGNPANSASCGLTATPPTTYSVDPNLRTEYGIISGLTLERNLARRGRAAVTYVYIRGDHQYLSQNVNAPLPGSGVYPLGITQGVYQFTSNGTEKLNQLSANFNLQLGQRITMYAFGTMQFENVDAATANTFPSNQYHLAQDFGRAAVPERQLFAGGNVKLPLGVSSDFYFNAQSGIPFNITTGTDLNGDGIYNDRPAYATAPTANSVLYRTRFGTFDANPQPGEATIPINAGDSPSFYFLQMTLRRRFAVGPRPAAPAPKPGQKGPATLPTRPWQIGLLAEAANILNHNNPGLPVGVLSSPQFGQSISLQDPFGSNPAANRRLTLRMSFVF